MFNYTAAPGQIGFPTSVAAVPLPAFPAGAQAPLRSLYVRPGDAPTKPVLPHQHADRLSERAAESVFRAVDASESSGVWHTDWVLSVDYVGLAHAARSIGRWMWTRRRRSSARRRARCARAQAANCTRPYWIWWYQQNGTDLQLRHGHQPAAAVCVIQSDVNDGYAYYDALDVNLSHSFSRKLSMLASYTWSHAIDNVDPDIPSQNPNDPTSPARWKTATRSSISGIASC